MTSSDPGPPGNAQPVHPGWSHPTAMTRQADKERQDPVDAPTGTVAAMDMRIEVVIIPVSDVQRGRSSTNWLGSCATPTRSPTSTSVSCS